MAERIPRVPVREQDPKVRAHNFDEVNLGYTKEMAQEEATRCLNCKHKPCVSGCPVGVRIPEFIQKITNTINIDNLYMNNFFFII